MEKTTMAENIHSHSLVYQPASYRICVCGRLELEWSERLAGMTVSIRVGKGGGTTTELYGRLPDQAALMGVLQQLYISGIPLLSLECLTPPDCVE
ncbi:MAG: hypothetical protein JSV31_15770 [Desulfobacterales bacterium]|nr:MAG: hypothetical protein JSV31_15770 [Desulfobacterales bacterium]